MSKNRSPVKEEAIDNEAELRAWRLLGVSEREQWQAAISRREKQKLKNIENFPRLSVENNKGSSTKKIIEVKDR